MKKYWTSRFHWPCPQAAIVMLMICTLSLILKNIMLFLQKLLSYCTKLGMWPALPGMLVPVWMIAGKNELSFKQEKCYWCSLKKLLHSKADAFLSNEYYDSDIAWMELVSSHDFCWHNFSVRLKKSGMRRKSRPYICGKNQWIYRFR